MTAVFCGRSGRHTREVTQSPLADHHADTGPTTNKVTVHHDSLKNKLASDDPVNSSDTLPTGPAVSVTGADDLEAKPSELVTSSVRLLPAPNDLARSSSPLASPRGWLTNQVAGWWRGGGGPPAYGSWLAAYSVLTSRQPPIRRNKPT